MVKPILLLFPGLVMFSRIAIPGIRDQRPEKKDQREDQFKGRRRRRKPKAKGGELRNEERKVKMPKRGRPERRKLGKQKNKREKKVKFRKVKNWGEKKVEARKTKQKEDARNWGRSDAVNNKMRRGR